MSEEASQVKFYGVFSVTPEGVKIREPEGYPAMYGGFIDFGNENSLTMDFVLIRDEIEYRKFVEKLEKIYEEDVDKTVKTVERLDKLSLEFSLDDVLKVADGYTTVIDDEDVEILKAGWSLAAKKYSRLVERAGIVGYEDWKEYEGLGRRLSEQINAHIWDLVFKRRTYKIEDLVNSLSREFGLDKDRAEVIVRTEMANIFNKAREWAYIEKTDAKKFVWVAKKDACEKCKEVESRASGGVGLRKLKKIISDVGGEYAQEWTVHPNCRCSFRKKYGGRKRWEKV